MIHRLRISRPHWTFPALLFTAGLLALTGCNDSARTSGQAPPPDAEAQKRRQEMEDFVKKNPSFGKMGKNRMPVK